MFIDKLVSSFTKSKNFAAASAFVLLLSLPVSASAEVISTKEMTGPANYIYVAGNPDLYPIEYFDKETESYSGVVPDILERVSDETGISFVYIGAGSKNLQPRLIKNGQTDIATAILGTDFGSDLIVSRVPLFTADINGNTETVYIGFTYVADKDMAEKITAALNSIPDSEKTEMVLSCAIENKPVSDSVNNLYITAIVLSAVGATLLIVFIMSKRKSAAAEKTSMLDPLTGIGSLNYFNYSIKSVFSSPVNSLYYMAYIAYDDKKLQDIYGKDVSENLQKTAAERLKAEAASEEYAARIKNGVFAFIYQNSNMAEAKKRIEKLVALLNGDIFKIVRGKHIRFCAGLCHMTQVRGLDTDIILNNAKQAYIHAAKNGVSFVLSTEKVIVTEKNKEKLRLKAAKALENNEFLTYMQFIVDTQTEKICGAEVLSRWNNPEFGLITPGSYMDILKETGIVKTHDYNVFEFLCKQLQAWSNTKYKNLFLSCNFTRISVSDKEFAQVIKEISGRYKFDRSRLLIEITEDSFVSDPKQVEANIKQCSDMGFKIAIDDMGSGFSSLSDLCCNKISIVKIERALVLEGLNERGSRLLNGLIALSHGVGAKVLCEGIETRKEREMIRNTDCDYTQGYYYSRTLPLDEAYKFLDDKTNI